MFYIYLSPQNIQRITEWIKSKVDYNFLNPAYTIDFKDKRVVLEQSDNYFKQVCPSCVLVQRYSLLFKCGHISCFPCLEKCRRHIFKFEIIVPCSICKQSSRLNEIYTYIVKNRKRPDSILMRMFKQAKVFCSYKRSAKSYLLKIIHHHEMFKCLYRSIMYSAKGCKFIKCGDCNFAR